MNKNDCFLLLRGEIYQKTFSSTFAYKGRKAQVKCPFIQEFRLLKCGNCLVYLCVGTNSIYLVVLDE